MRSIEKMCLVVTSEMTIKAFLRAHILSLASRYDLTVVVNTNNPDFAKENGLPVKIVSIGIERAIKPVADLRALWALFRLFRHQRFDLIHSVTPKAGLLAMLAGKMAGIPFRIHTFTGQVWAVKHGLSRLLLKRIDCFMAFLATGLLADSSSQRQFLIDQKVVSEDKLQVLADGSISGVDVERFRPDDSVRKSMRQQFGFVENDVVLLFLGRLNQDKGVLDLAAAFSGVAAEAPYLQLLMVGPDEGGMKCRIESLTSAFDERVHFIDYTDKPERYFAAADLFCLPSYREGFGSVIIEAAACGVPAIGSNIYGVLDAVKDAETGILFQVGKDGALVEAIRQMIHHPDQRERMGKAALLRARKYFPVNRLVRAWKEYYDGLL